MKLSVSSENTRLHPSSSHAGLKAVSVCSEDPRRRGGPLHRNTGETDRGLAEDDGRGRVDPQPGEQRDGADRKGGVDAPPVDRRSCREQICIAALFVRVEEIGDSQVVRGLCFFERARWVSVLAPLHGAPRWRLALVASLHEAERGNATSWNCS